MLTVLHRIDPDENMDRYYIVIIQATLFVAALIQILLVTVGTAGPFVLESIFKSRPFGDDTLIQITNPFWSIVHVIDQPNPAEGPVLLIVVPLAALVVFLFNLPGILHEVRHVRVAKPERVAEEDELLSPTVPQGPVQISPWDEV